MLNNKTKPGAAEVESKEPLKPTIRLNLSLSEPNKEWCPVFNYQSLLKAALEEREKLGESPSEDDEARKKAKKLEEKYGKENYQKRCRTYTELGAGYDESDSFIDNSEAVEEGLDHSYIKKHDGFYVNCEKFASASGSEQSDVEIAPRRTKKGAVDSSSVSSEESTEVGRVKKSRPSQEETESVTGSSMVSEESGTANKKAQNPVYDYDALMELEHKHLVRNGDGNDKNDESSPEEDY